MSLIFTVNNTKYWIDEFEGGFAWVSRDDEGLFCYPTQAEAMQSAIDYERLKIEMRRAAEVSEQDYHDYLYN